MIVKCACRHQFQDEVYGAGMRVHNPCNKGSRCTVCGNIAISKDGKLEEKKDSKKDQ